MNTLETTPIEALALHYITDGLLNSVWTWIAVLTAAVSFWKIKLSSQQQQQLVLTSHDSTSISSSLGEKSDQVATSTTETKRTYVMERQGSTKIKFTVHYEQQEHDYRSSDECVSVEEEEEEESVDECLRWCEDRERMWDMGWYKCQDLTVLDGSVVRLWDGRKENQMRCRHHALFLS